MGGRKTLISGRVMSSGYIPPVSSNRACLSKLSELWWIKRESSWDDESESSYIPNLSATPGKYHTGTTAALPMLTYTWFSITWAPVNGWLLRTIEPSTSMVPFLAALSNALIFKWGFVMVMLGRTSKPRSSISCLKTSGTTCPHGLKETIFVGAAQVGFGGMLIGGEVRL